MDFKAFTEKAKEKTKNVTSKVKDFTDKTLEKTSQKFAETKVFIMDTDELTKREVLDMMIDEEKSFVVIFGKKETQFFKQMMLSYPVLLTKGWVQNLKIKLYVVDEDENFDGDYKIQVYPTLIIFRSGMAVECVEGEEKVKALVKKLSLGIEGVV